MSTYTHERITYLIIIQRATNTQNLNHCSLGGRVDESPTLVLRMLEIVMDTSGYLTLFLSEFWLSGHMTEQLFLDSHEIIFKYITLMSYINNSEECLFFL